MTELQLSENPSLLENFSVQKNVNGNCLTWKQESTTRISHNSVYLKIYIYIILYCVSCSLSKKEHSSHKHERIIPDHQQNMCRI